MGRGEEGGQGDGMVRRVGDRSGEGGVCESRGIGWGGWGIREEGGSRRGRGVVDGWGGGEGEWGGGLGGGGDRTEEGREGGTTGEGTNSTISKNDDRRTGQFSQQQGMPQRWPGSTIVTTKKALIFPCEKKTRGITIGTCYEQELFIPRSSF